MQNISEKIKKSPICAAAENVTATLNHHGYRAYFVGGAVRDMLLGQKPKDIDIVTDALPEDVTRIFPHSHPVGAAFGIINVVRGKYVFEVATFREEREYLDGRHPENVYYTDNPELDAARRDFTINGMFYDPEKQVILDFHSGQSDLRRGILRTIGNAAERFSEDYLRILRAVRFTTRFGFSLDIDIPPAIKRLKYKLPLLSAERIRTELNLMLLGKHPAAAVRMLTELGILEVILPEIAALDGVTQPEKFHPEGDVMTHTLLMLDHIAIPSEKLVWSALLHDVGKPVTKFTGEDGIDHFYSHEEAGAEMAENIMRRLRFSRDTTEAVVHATRNHMRFAHVDKMRQAKWKRLLAEPEFPLELELHRLDCISSHGKLENYLLLLDRLTEASGQTELPPPLLNGRDLIQSGLKPGPVFGEILNKITDMQLSGTVTTREEAMAQLQTMLKQLDGYAG